MRKLNIQLRCLPLIAASLFAVSCTQKEHDMPIESSLVEVESVTMTAHDFEYDGVQTKTSIVVSDTEGAKFFWSSDDVVGVFPNLENATQVRFPISDGEVEGGTSTSQANFTGNGWAVMRANTYMSYYPFIPDMNLDKTAIPVNYEGQTQVGSGSTEHLYTYDFMAAAPTEPSSNGNISLDFQHMGALLQLIMNVPKTGTYTSLTLSCDGMPFITSGVIDATADVPAIEGVEFSYEFVINLQDLEITEENHTAVIYALIAPVDMSGQTIDVRLQGPHADFRTSFTRGENKPFKAGKAYRPSLGELSGGDVVMLEMGQNFNSAIKTLAHGGEQFRYDEFDYKVKHIVFRANTDETPSGTYGVDYTDVSDGSSAQHIWASWDASTSTITVTSPSYRVYSNVYAHSMFNKFYALQDLECDDLDVSFSTVFDNMFAECGNITTLDLSGWRTQNAGSLRNMFYGCSRLETLDVSSFDVSKVGDFVALFCGCSSLKNVDFSTWTSERPEGCIVPEMFSGCSSIETIDLRGLKLPIEGDLYQTFFCCHSLKNLRIQGWNTSKATAFSGTFAGLTSMESFDDFKYISTESAISLSGLFSGCSKLKSIDLSNINTEQTENFSGMFRQCSSLESLDLSKLSTKSGKYFGEMFHGCSSLTSLDVTHFVTSSAQEFSWMFKDCSGLSSIDVSGFETYNVRRFDAMFSGCSGLKSLDITNFDFSNAETIANMFNGCSSLTSLDIHNVITPVCSDMSYLFFDCRNLAAIEFPSRFDTHRVESFEGMFQDCRSVKELRLSMFVTDQLRNARSIFANCPSLEYVDVSSFNMSHVRNVACMFRNELEYGIYTESYNVINFGRNFNFGEVDMSEWREENRESLACVRHDATIICSQELKEMIIQYGLINAGTDSITWIDPDDYLNPDEGVGNPGGTVDPIGGEV